MLLGCCYVKDAVLCEKRGNVLVGSLICCQMANLDAIIILILLLLKIVMQGAKTFVP